MWHRDRNSLHDKDRCIHHAPVSQKLQMEQFDKTFQFHMQKRIVVVANVEFLVQRLAVEDVQISPRNY